MLKLPVFRDREAAALQLAQRLKQSKLRDPLVLAIPRGGVVLGAVLARELGAELDVILARKLRAPHQPEYAIGAVSEDGEVFLNAFATRVAGVTEDYLREESAYQVAEIGRRRKLFRSARPAAPVPGRSIILTDDGMATGSTMLAALRVLNARGPHETIVAVPVAPADLLEQFHGQCSRVECLVAPADLGSVGSFYRSFEQVEDEEVIRLLRDCGKPLPRPAAAR